MLPLSYPNQLLSIYTEKLSTIFSHFRNRWWYEYLTNLRENYKISKEKRNKHLISVNNIVIIEEPNFPLLSWKLARINGNDEKVKGPLVEVSKINSSVKKSFNNLYLLENHYKPVDVLTDNGGNVNNYTKDNIFMKSQPQQKQQSGVNCEGNTVHNRHAGMCPMCGTK